MTHTNSASRILSILKQAHEHEDAKKAFQVWADVFDIHENNQNKKNMEITRCLSLMHDEIELIQEEMELASYDEFQCRLLLNSVYNVLSVQSLMGQWNALKPQLTREVFLCLGYCRQILPDEEDTVDSQDVEEIYELISTLKSQLKDSSLPKFTQKMIQSHINGILKALHNYKILGASSLQSAMNSVVGELVVNEDVIMEAKDSEEFSTLVKIVKKVNSVTDTVVKAEKVLSSGAKIAGHGAKALQYLEGIM
jgi:hypothetical protein